MSTALDDLTDNLRFLQERADLDQQPEREEVAPAFQDHILPDPFKSYVAAHANAIGVPQEMVAIPALAYVGGFIGNRLAISLKAGFLQFAGIWVGIVAPPGSAKTPAINAARSPIDVLQKEAYTQFCDQRLAWEAELQSWEAGPKEDRGAKPAKPVMRHYVTTDTTMEAQVTMLASTSGLTVTHDELAGWVLAMNAYRKGGNDRQQHLSMWAFAPIKQDRRGADPIYIPHPVESVVGGIQDDILPDLPDRNGRRDGFIERFLLIRPDAAPRRWSEDEADPVLLDHVVGACRTLDERLDLMTSVTDQQCMVRLSPEARAIWREWYDRNVERISISSGIHAGFLSKLPLQVARFALILNTLWNLDDPQRMVSPARMEDAIDLGEFCLAHFERTVPLMAAATDISTSSIQSRIMKVLRTDEKADPEGWVARGHIILRLGNVKADDLTPELIALKQEGLLESRLVPTKTRPREEWRPTPLNAGNNSKIRSFSRNPSNAAEFSFTSDRNNLREEFFAFEESRDARQETSNHSNCSGPEYEEII